MKKQMLASILGMAGLAMMMGGASSSTSDRGTNDGSIGHGAPDVKPTVIPKGCKEYTFYGHTVIALNEKSARKKCDRLVKSAIQERHALIAALNKEVENDQA